MKSKLIRATAALALCAAAAAQAAIVTIDDFNTPDVFLSDALGGGATTSTDAVRKLSHELLAGLAGPAQYAQIGSGSFPAGSLEISNGSGRDSEVIATWQLANGLVPTAAQNVSFLFNVILSDGNATSLDFTFNGNSLASFNIAPNTANQLVAFNLTATQAATLSGGGALGLRINGDVGWDLAIDSFGVRFDAGSQVPEPASLGLVGLALTGLGAARRRRARSA